jgi:hypothetical protein
MANAPLTYPLGGPTVSGTTWTVDFLLNDPKRVTRAIANLALQRFMVDRIFSPAGDITGGAVIYDQATSNDLYLTRDVERVEPGKDFPIVTGRSRSLPRLRSSVEGSPSRTRRAAVTRSGP